MASLCIRSHLSVSVCPSVCNVLTSESLDLESSFSYAGTALYTSGQICISRSSDQGQGHISKQRTLCVFAV